MKLALLSDIHSNIQALNACLEDAGKRGASQFALLGDFVGYGGDPVAVVEVVQELVEQGAFAIKGNHDEMAVNVPKENKTLGSSSAQWTHDTLKPEQRRFLSELPFTMTVGQCLLVHASADEPEKWRYVTDERSASASLDNAFLTVMDGERMELSQATWVFGGHVHHHSLYYEGRNGELLAFSPTADIALPVPSRRRWVVTVGSVGQPRDGNPMAMYSIFDAIKHTLTFVRVPYDHCAAAASIRRAGLPDFFADRLESGR